MTVRESAPLETQVLNVFRPTTVAEALRQLKRYGSACRVIAGGTDAMVEFQAQAIPQSYLLSLERIRDNELRTLTTTGKDLKIGALVTIRTLETSELMRSQFPFISEMAHVFGSIQIRNVATVGGNLCRASPSADVAPPLLALDAKAYVRGPSRSRSQPLRSFFLGPAKTTLKPNEILTHIEASVPAAPWGGTFLKHYPRSPHDIATVSVAVLIKPDRSIHSVKTARIALGAVAPTPMLAQRAQDHLVGKAWANNLVQEASSIAASESRPIDDVRGSAEYRRWMVRVLTGKALRLAWKRAKDGRTFRRKTS